MLDAIRGMEYVLWMAKADGDRDVAKEETVRNNHPDISCYHIQQAMEKYIKAQLISVGEEPDRTANIRSLLDQVYVSLGEVPPRALRGPAGVLTDYEVAARYPGPDFTCEDYGRGVVAFDAIAASLDAMGLDVPSWDDPPRFLDAQDCPDDAAL